MSDRSGSIKVLSDDVIGWVVSCPMKKVDDLTSPDFFLDAYKASAFIFRKEDDFDFIVDIFDADWALRLSNLTITLIKEKREKVVFTDKVENYSDGGLSCEFKISRKDIAEFHQTFGTSAEGEIVIFEGGGRLEFRFNFEMDEKFRKLPVVSYLDGSMAKFFMSEELSDGTLVILFLNSFFVRKLLMRPKLGANLMKVFRSRFFFTLKFWLDIQGEFFE